MPREQERPRGVGQQESIFSISLKLSGCSIAEPHVRPPCQPQGITQATQTSLSITRATLEPLGPGLRVRQFQAG
jgi:hypothetical protein